MDICYCDAENIAFAMIVSVIFNAILLIISMKITTLRSKSVEKTEEVISSDEEFDDVATDDLIESPHVIDPPSGTLRRRIEDWPVIIITKVGEKSHRQGCRYTKSQGIEKKDNKKRYACPICFP